MRITTSTRPQAPKKSTFHEVKSLVFSIPPHLFPAASGRPSAAYSPPWLLRLHTSRHHSIGQWERAPPLSSDTQDPLGSAIWTAPRVPSMAMGQKQTPKYNAILSSCVTGLINGLVISWAYDTCTCHFMDFLWKANKLPGVLADATKMPSLLR